MTFLKVFGQVLEKHLPADHRWEGESPGTGGWVVYMEFIQGFRIYFFKVEFIWCFRVIYGVHLGFLVFVWNFMGVLDCL